MSNLKATIIQCFPINKTRVILLIALFFLPFAWFRGFYIAHIIKDDFYNSHTYQIDLNYANIEELTLIPGIGFHLAHEIDKYRLTNGIIDNTNDLLNINGIGYHKMSGILKWILPFNGYLYLCE